MIFDCDRVTSGFLHCIANFEEFVWGWQGDCETGEGIYVNINWTTKKCSVLSTASACTTHISAIKWTNEVKIVLIYRLKFHVPMHFLWHYSTITAHRRCYMAARRYEFHFRVIKTRFYELAQRESSILYLTRENKSHIFMPPCNFIFVM